MSTAAGGTVDGSAWRRRPRAASAETFTPPALQAKPNLKTLEAELQHQASYLQSKIQHDLDSLHEQVHAEIHAAITQELLGVAHRIASVQREGQAELETLRVTVGQLCEEAKWVRSVREQDAIAAKESAKESAQKVSQEAVSEVRAQWQAEALQLQAQLKQLSDRAESLTEAQETGAKETEAREAELGERLGVIFSGALAESARDFDEKLLLEAAKAQKLERELLARLDAEERARLEETARSASQGLQQLQDALESEAAVASARFRECQAAVAELERRQAQALADSELRLSVRADATDAASSAYGSLAGDLDGRLAEVSRHVEDRLGSATQEIRHLGMECREGLAFAHSSWARIIDWSADLDLGLLELEGKCDVASPIFSAAGLRSLQLQLRAVRSASGKSRWTIGVFLRAPSGQVSFKLHVGGKSQSFAAEFGEAPEWGSQRIVVLENLGLGSLKVRLEIMDIVAPVPLSHGPALENSFSLTASMRCADAVQAAAREAAAFRSAMVRRIEWRVTRVAERVAAARAAANSLNGDDEALEPLCSPPFAAGGFEGLQLQLYPLGYRPRGEESCGFFLLCPKGMYVKCRAFVGDAVRNFEHTYGDREPYGRGSFCRLSDKVGDDDTVVVGVELLEIRMEHTTQVRGGPFGSVADQLKIVSHPPVGSMVPVRELVELGHSKEGTRRSAAHRNPTSQGGSVALKMVEPRPIPPFGAQIQGALSAADRSKSLPMLQAANSYPAGAAAEAVAFPLSPSHRGVDASPWR